MISSDANCFRMHENGILNRELQCHLGAGEHVPTYDLIFGRKALDQGQLAEAERYLRRALSCDPESAEARSLMGVVHERLSEHHSAYRFYRAALELDRYDTIALAGLRRYCERFRLDFRNPAINPAALART
jgi:tetratricopeptide (TPR) repeat protein